MRTLFVLFAVSDKIQWSDLDDKSSVSDWSVKVGDVIERTCPTCASGHKMIVYKRLKNPGTIDFKNLFLHQVEMIVVIIWQ